jgi:hypothetical protein
MSKNYPCDQGWTKSRKKTNMALSFVQNFLAKKKIDYTPLEATSSCSSFLNN